jgi:HD-like signal output (HDOD) protein
MWILILCVLLLVGILSYLIISKGNKKNRPLISQSRGKNPLRSSGKGKPVGGPPIFSKNLPQNGILNATGILIPEREQSNQSDEVKKRIQEGIETIFSAKSGKNLEQKKPLQLEEIDRKVKETVLEVISRLKDFRAAYQIYKALDDPRTSMSDLSKLIVTDPVLSGKILKVANSSYFGMEQQVNSIGHALLILGLLNLKNILYREGLLKLLNVDSFMKDFSVEPLWEHATLTSICASYIHPLFKGLDKGILFTLGLLHDVGKFVMTGLSPVKSPQDNLIRNSPAEFSIYDEDEIFGINHAVIGRLAFEEWGFSDLMVRMVERHHAPSWLEMHSVGLDQEPLQYLLVLFLSDQAAKLFAGEGKSIFPLAPLSSSYHSLIERKKLLSLVLDSSLFSEIRKAKALMKSNT